MGQLLTHKFITRSNKNILNRLIYCFTLLRSDVQTIIVETAINLWYCAIYSFILHPNFPVVISYFMPWSVLHYLYTHLPAWCDTCCHRVQFPWVTIYNYVAIAHLGLYTSDIGLGRCCMGNIRMHLKHGSRDGIMASSDGSGWSRAFAGIILQCVHELSVLFPRGAGSIRELTVYYIFVLAGRHGSVAGDRSPAFVNDCNSCEMILIRLVGWHRVVSCHVIRHSRLPGFVRIFFYLFYFFILPPSRFPDDNFWPPSRTAPEF